MLCIASLVSGPLARGPAYSAKVATSPQEETSNNQHLIYIYMPNVYERDGVIEVTLYFSQQPFGLLQDNR
jgi:hypothetical protein